MRVSCRDMECVDCLFPSRRVGEAAEKEREVPLRSMTGLYEYRRGIIHEISTVQLVGD